MQDLTDVLLHLYCSKWACLQCICYCPRERECATAKYLLASQNRTHVLLRHSENDRFLTAVFLLQSSLSWRDITARLTFRWTALSCKKNAVLVLFSFHDQTLLTFCSLWFFCLCALELFFLTTREVSVLQECFCEGWDFSISSTSYLIITHSTCSS